MTRIDFYRIIFPLGLILLWGIPTNVSAQVSFGELAGTTAEETDSKSDGEKKKNPSVKRPGKKSDKDQNKGPSGLTDNDNDPDGDSQEAAMTPVKQGGPILGKSKKIKYRVGLSLEARPNGECSDIFGSVPFPIDFHDQKVRVIEEEFPDGIRVKYRDLKEGGCRQMLIRMRTLKAGEKAEAAVTVEVTRFEETPPEDPSKLSIPKPIPKEVKDYLKESPFIETTDRKIKKTAREIVSDDVSDWRKAENILHFVREKVKYKEAYKEKTIRGALAALESGEGDCEDMSALFIALCRVTGIPARTVRVPEHCWAEFYLEDESRNGFWFPVQVAGNEPIGVLTDLRPILQKGDAFKVPETPRETSRYVRELFTGSVAKTGQDPKHRFIWEEVR